MDELREIYQDALEAQEAGDHAEALRLHQHFYDYAAKQERNLHRFGRYALHHWKELGDVYPPALAALQALREREAALLLDGETMVAIADGSSEPRFPVIVDINHLLEDERATYELFQQFQAKLPEQAAQSFRYAAGAIVACGDFQLASGYLPEPMAAIEEEAEYLNRLFREMTADTSAPSVMRLMADTLNYADTTLLQWQVLTGLGKEEKAREYAEKAEALLERPSLRQAIRREFAAPGSLLAESVQRQEAFWLRDET
ncbi:hypothetical protein [Massilia sp. NR 4-1]|uniref:hypothetical protein n=1 Tax=Massilia sp. NR 4-1 TaxID=1678028 RepID=UPI00067AF4AF|nr:hypothetical protein [Massilia sp. NR 4-1]AKU21976.1 hypothetical protein ACZ75_11390 [Massilia sp. NR 4-1]